MSENEVPEDTIERAKASLGESVAARDAARPMLDYASGVVERLREERTTNGWAEAVRARFQETRGAA